MAKRRHQIYTVRDLLALEDDPNRWIVPSMLQKSNRILVFGEGGHFKSTIVFDLCVAVASDRQLLRQFEVLNHGPVLLNSTEGSKYDNRDRLLSHMRAHGLSPTDVQLEFCQDPYCLDDAADISELEKEIKRLRPILVVLDPLDSFFSGDENSAKETKAVRRTIDRLIEDYKCSFIVIHHQGKLGKDSQAKPSPRGSTAWTGWADAVLHVSLTEKKLGLPEPTKVVTVESLKQRNGQKGHVFSAVPYIDTVLRETSFVYYDGTDASGIVLEYWKHKVYATLRTAPEPMTNKMIAEVLGTRQQNVAAPLAALEAAGLIAKDAKLARATGVGSRMRQVDGWRALTPLSNVDATKILMKDEEDDMEAVELCEPEPADASLADETDGGGLCEAGTATGS